MDEEIKENPGINLVLSKRPKRLPRKLKKRYAKPNKWSQRYERLMASGKFWCREFFGCQIVGLEDAINQDPINLDGSNLSINIQYDYEFES